MTILSSQIDPRSADFLANAAADWAKLPEPGPEVVANIHAAPEMLAQGGRPGANSIVTRRTLAT